MDEASAESVRFHRARGDPRALLLPTVLGLVRDRYPVLDLQVPGGERTASSAPVPVV